MKKIIFISILLVLTIPFASAITTNDLKSVLKEALLAYFENPSNSRLEVNELRDLLISFFEAPTGQDVDLNKVGKHSGKLLQEIYDRAKIEEWTIMVFMNGDNSLEEFGILNMNEMEKVGSSNSVNVIVLFDRSAEWDNSNGDWDTAKMFYITKDDNNEKINSKELIDLGEIDMSSSKSLEDFVLYSMEKYPAKHYMLVLWNHGGGWTSLSNDDTDNPNGMSVQELVEALGNIKDKKNIKLDIIGFDMCSMAMLEVYSQISEFGDIAIGSEELEPGEGWNYADLLKFITENPDSDAKTFASKITQAYFDFHKDKTSEITLSAVDLTQIDNILNSISEIISKISTNMNQEWKTIARAIYEVDRYKIPVGRNSVDIIDFFWLLAIKMNINVDNAELFNDALAFKEFVATAVIDKISSPGHFFASGISIYFPSSSSEYHNSYELKNQNFIEKTGWENMIKKYYSLKELDKEPPQVLIESYDVQSDKINFKVNLSGNDILALFFVVSVKSNNISIDWLETPVTFDFTRFETGQIEYSWDYTIPFLFNGENYTFANFKPTDRTGKKFFTEGLYRHMPEDEVFNATLYFDEGQLTSVYILEISGDEFKISPIKISRDDIFIPYLRAFDLQTNEFFNEESDPIKISEGLSIEHLITADLSQEYLLHFVAEDLSENQARHGIIYKK